MSGRKQQQQKKKVREMNDHCTNKINRCFLRLSFQSVRSRCLLIILKCNINQGFIYVVLNLVPILKKEVLTEK